ncbi:regulator of protease activity HflC (stomatin/prohibitin superfamily) [Saccharopolyspora erythraea NRRL 2338]|uniref:Membrane protease subunit, stomatin/prohibitin homolog n=4 Tax=Saccharopolyspora erythraea TaxID=1836 RepID=A4F8H6_SACEN|nr:regulator of protease activity HflC (stomatin/prohibitin superfamily) [Saccharopolyspora erythraea NRRL 2338]CAM00351.1 membrane protease subunit, stomatin/prohibitin homolog [Saccharopolyspora erythraea NRRL 2338]
MIIEGLLVALVLVVVYVASAVKVVKQYERGVVFRFGRLQEHTRGPGLTTIVPAVDRLRKVNLQIVTMPVPAQEGITRDNVTVRVDAVVYFKVEDAARAIVNVEDYLFAVGQVAQTSLRSIIGKSDLDDLLSNRERLNQGLELMIDNPALGWGVHIDRVEIKDVSLPESMKRSIARQAEAERERRSRVIAADGEYQASQRLADAATVMADTPAALQLRLLETVVEVAAEKNSTLVLPFPVELLRFVEKVKSDQGGGEAAQPSAAPEPRRPEPDRPAEPAWPTGAERLAGAGPADAERPAGAERLEAGGRQEELGAAAPAPGEAPARGEQLAQEEAQEQDEDLVRQADPADDEPGRRSRMAGEPGNAETPQPRQVPDDEEPGFSDFRPDSHRPLGQSWTTTGAD